MQQSMVKGFATLGGSLHENAQVVNHLLLSRKAFKHVGTQGVLEVFLSLSQVAPIRIKVTVHRFDLRYKDTTFDGNWNVIKKMYLCSLNFKEMKRIICLIIFTASALLTFAQNHGSLNVDQDSRIESLIAKQRSLYHIDSSFSGYRIHIFMEIGNEALKHAEQVKRQFERSFPDIPIYLTYAEPYFRLRAGNFRDRVEAEKCLRRIKPKYKEAFVTSDMIYRPRVDLYKNEE
jgi:hypothetical protein